LPVKLNTGALIAGVLGTHKFVYDVWGDTVNTNQAHGKVRPAPARSRVRRTRRALGEVFCFEPRGALVIKVKALCKPISFIDNSEAQKPSGCCKSAGSEVCRRVERPLCVELLGANPT
jgi:hypothetical protein